MQKGAGDYLIFKESRTTNHQVVMVVCVLYNICSDCCELISESDLDDSDSYDNDGGELGCRKLGQKHDKL